jgi:hypothetical protein
MKNNSSIIKITIILLLINYISCWDYVPPNSVIKQYIPSTFNINPYVTALNSGDYIVAWPACMNAIPCDIYFIITNSSGSTKVNATKVNTIAKSNYLCTIQVDNLGGFVIAWSNTINRTTNCPNRTDYIYARYFDSTYKGGDETLILTYTRSYCFQDTFPSVVFINSSFLLCSNAILQQFTNAINLVGSWKSIELGQSLQTPNTNCVLSDLKNGTVAVAFIYLSTLQYAILNGSNLSFIVPVTYLKSDKPQTNPSIALLSTNQFLISWVETSNTVKQTLYNIDGSNPGQIKAINTGTVYYSLVKTLGTNGYVLTYNTGSLVKYRLYNNDTTDNGGEQALLGSSSTQYSSFGLVGNQSKFISVHADANLFLNINIATYSTITFIPCINLSIIIGSANNPKVKLPFDTTDTNSNIYITQMPTKGILTNNSGTSLNLNTQYLETDVYYNYSNPPSIDLLSYTNQQGGSTCQVSVNTCYISCSQCKVQGDSSSHKCDVCNSFANYFPLVDNSSNCYQVTNYPDGYYLDSTIWKKCYIGCKTCSGYPTDPTVDMKCILCVDGYILQESNCYTVGNVPSKCYTNCETCTGLPTDPSIDMKCNTCKNGYVQKGTNCYTIANMPLGCYKLCKTCTGFPTDPSKDMLCESNSCISGYFPNVDNMTSCFTGDILYYYFDRIVYRRCHPYCLTCNSTPGTDSNNQCKSCIANYYPKVDQPYNCFSGNIPSYFLNGTTYQKCYSTCLSCNSPGMVSDHQCTSCLPGYYSKIDIVSSCFTGNQNYYYLDGRIYQKCHITCKTCTNVPASSNDHQCTQCISDYYPKVDSMSSCFTGEQGGYYLDEGIYMLNEPTIASTDITTNANPSTCSPTPCLNNSNCVIILNKFQCNCVGDFIGSICQYDKNTINIKELLNDYYQTHSQHSINDLMAIIKNQPNLIDDITLELLYQSIRNYYLKTSN